MSLLIPHHYDPVMDVRTTEKAIKEVKDKFEQTLALKLHLNRVSAPLFVFPETGLNDNLNGVERPVSFDVSGVSGRIVEVVHSLAKWKRVALDKYHFAPDEGLYTDMNAIRRDEELDNLHSIYVDQWDWEKIILKEQRKIATLKETVEAIFETFKIVEEYIIEKYPKLTSYLPGNITFITSQELLDMYPNLSPEEREDAICKKHKAVFISQIGGVLSNGEKHDGRAPDYDDWSLNGDLLIWYPILDRAVEVSSMGIRVDENALKSQLELAGCEKRSAFQYHQDILQKRLPYTIGGGLGQSRICMILLGKAHIGEVQASIWPEDMIETCGKSNIWLL